mmetsp:Transcript_26209/g.42885  ORF Transcript_26209/g.42885 Transcript_26209/m.42885 type:complete len:174 (+) Transcript_26209:1465-1986(+)
MAAATEIDLMIGTGTTTIRLATGEMVTTGEMIATGEMVSTSLSMGGMTGITRALSMGGMTEGTAETTVETGALQEMVIGITTADAVDPGRGAMTAEVGAGAEVLATGGDEAAAAVIPAMGTDPAAGGLLVIRGEAPPTAIRTIPRSVRISPVCHTCFHPRRHLLLRRPRVLRT